MEIFWVKNARGSVFSDAKPYPAVPILPSSKKWRKATKSSYTVHMAVLPKGLSSRILSSGEPNGAISDTVRIARGCWMLANQIEGVVWPWSSESLGQGRMWPKDKKFIVCKHEQLGEMWLSVWAKLLGFLPLFLLIWESVMISSWCGCWRHLRAECHSCSWLLNRLKVGKWIS